ncbi:cytochrome oxidase assembly protein ShyY1 [Actinokineospora baliensis]|uniref:SURF1 family cytochrome oxidase biogenesis protein n=1 Tax=Actinokineospora baliensis TaxID=547056 RepID=UPI0019571C91|nr:SURF1 family cytochrome oxidase biogenesis protein [Actinokineospora baliensis]MBM7772146.1 cytochrome oxidase assembly protein ShyY1 [Actinokineospora baliensis]
MRLKLLLRPGWLMLALVVVAFAVTCFTLLAPWQFQRHDERQATNDAVQSSFDAPPAPIGSVPSDPWRRVTLTGSYLPEGEALARLRTVQGNAAFEVLTPFRLANGSVVLVDRGYVRPGEGVRVPDYAQAPAGQVNLLARVRGGESTEREAFEEDGHRQVYAIDPGVVGRAANLKIEPGYVQLEEGSPGVLGALPLPQLEAGPFLSYALQWIAFGAMALLGLFYFTWREIKPGGSLTEDRPKRQSVAEILAEDEARERAASG